MQVHTFAATNKSETKLVAVAEERATDITRHTSPTNSYLSELTKIKILQNDISSSNAGAERCIIEEEHQYKLTLTSTSSIWPLHRHTNQSKPPARTDTPNKAHHRGS